MSVLLTQPAFQPLVCRLSCQIRSPEIIIIIQIPRKLVLLLRQFYRPLHSRSRCRGIRSSSSRNKKLLFNPIAKLSRLPPTPG